MANILVFGLLTFQQILVLLLLRMEDEDGRLKEAALTDLGTSAGFKGSVADILKKFGIETSEGSGDIS